MEIMNNFVISLVSAEERRRHIEREFGREAIPFAFFDAVTPQTNLDNCIRTHLPNLARVPNLTDGEKACFMSQFLLWKKCVQEKMPYISVFEDDVYLSRHAGTFLASDEWLKRIGLSGRFIIKLETVNTLCRTEPFCRIDDGHTLNFLRSDHYGGGAYMLSYQAAEQLVRIVEGLSWKEIEPVDHFLFDAGVYRFADFIYQLSPAVCIQEIIKSPDSDYMASFLEPARKKKNSVKIKRTFWEKLGREWARWQKKRHQKKYRHLPCERVPFDG